MIPYGKQYLSADDFASVHSALESPHLTVGPRIRQFEDALEKLTGAKHAIACANGTAALHLACLAAGIAAGDRVLTSPITFVASGNCAEFCGGLVDFIDIDPHTLCLSPTLLKRYCETGAIPTLVIPVDFAGVPAALPEIYELSRHHGFRVIEDAAHSIGSTYTHNGVEYQCGSCAHSDMAIFSFHPVKTVTTGEGGAVLTNDDELAQRLRSFRAHGIERAPERMTRWDGPWYYEMQSLGFNYRITDFQCALGLSQLTQLDNFKQKRAAIVDEYRAIFSHDTRLIVPELQADSSPCYHLFPLQFAEGPARRLDMYTHLLQRGIQTQVHYIPVYWHPYYKTKYGYPEGYCPAAEKYYSGCLSLPLYPAMSRPEIDHVVSCVLEGMTRQVANQPGQSLLAS